MNNFSIPKISRICKWGDCIYYNQYVLGQSITILSDVHSILFSMVENYPRWNYQYLAGYYFVVVYSGSDCFDFESFKNFYDAKQFIKDNTHPCFILSRSVNSR